MEQKKRLVLIEWEDSHGFEGIWQDIEGCVEDKPLLCRSVGWLILDGEYVKILAPHKAGNGQMAGVMTIPTRVVNSIENLSPVL